MRKLEAPQPMMQGFNLDMPQKNMLKPEPMKAPQFHMDIEDGSHMPQFNRDYGRDINADRFRPERPSMSQ